MAHNRFRANTGLQTGLLLAFLLISGCTALTDTGGKAQGPTEDSPENKIAATCDLKKDDNFVRSLCAVGPSLWVGTEHGIYETTYNRKEHKLSVVKFHDAAVEDAKINSIRPDGGAVMVASREGFSIYRNGSWERQQLGNINDVIRVGEDLWAATNSGIEILRAGSREWRDLEVSSVTDHFPTKKMTCLCCDNETSVWVGTEFGVHHFDLAAFNQFQHSLANYKPGGGGAFSGISPANYWKRYFGDYQNPAGGLLANESGNSGLSGNTIKAIRYDSSHRRFLFCTERGISLLKAGVWKSYIGRNNVFAMTPDGKLTRREVQGNIDVPTAEVYDAAVFRDDIFLATRSGLARVSPDGTTSLVTMDNGLPSNRVTSLSLDENKGLLYVGTENGLAVLDISVNRP